MGRSDQTRFTFMDFDDVWHRLSLGGFCADIGGAEWRRIKKEWRHVGFTLVDEFDIKELELWIIARANRSPEGNHEQG